MWNERLIAQATSLTPIWRITSATFWPCDTRTSTCRNFATISSGVDRFFAIAVLLDAKDILQVNGGGSPHRRGRVDVSLVRQLRTFLRRYGGSGEPWAAPVRK